MTFQSLERRTTTKSFLEIVTAPPTDGAGSQEPQKESTVHLILSYKSADSGTTEGKRANRKKRMSDEKREEEESLLLSLTEVACGGWKTADAGETVAGGKKAKRRRQERGFQGTFLQSTSELDVSRNPSLAQDTETAPETLQHDESVDVVIVDSPEKADVPSNGDGKDCGMWVDKDLVKDTAEATVQLIMSSQGSVSY